MTALEAFLQRVEQIHSTGAGVPETSYYGAVETLFNEVGKKLKPAVFCVIQIANRGAGSPDAGFYTEEQREKKKGHEPKQGQKPSRGAIEVKPPSPKFEVEEIAKGEQAQRYLKAYRQVLVTNLREWLLLAFDADGKPVELERYKLAGTEKEFWEAAAHPKKTAANHGLRFEEYLKRVMKHKAPVAAPEDLAEFLASYARDALARIEATQELPALGAVRTALEEALGLKFEGPKGEHFFRSSLIQTLFYGVFSAWVLWARQRERGARDKFEWKQAAWLLRVPVIRKLFHQLADPGQLEELNLSEVMDWAAAVLTRVDRVSFFQKFKDEHAVQYFYEPFLEEFDPVLRKELGVWYTPHEVVQYMVARVDTVLREQLGLADGLANKNVYVLDPGNGTGSYLVEVLRQIQTTLKKKGDDALLAAELKEAALNRIRGFELIPASFVVAHLQIGLLLQQVGAPLNEKKNERAGVFLTNSLTGWEAQEQKKLEWPELEEERRSSGRVKREEPILVIIGNPPYNAFAGVSPKEEEGLVDSYKEGLVKDWKIKKFNLDDLYVRFFRIAERRIVDRKPHKGIVCYISNFSYLGDPSFVVMRKRFLREFDELWFDCLNGDSRETGKLTPAGEPDPSVFSTEYNREGIRIGTAVGLLVRKGTNPQNPVVRFRHFWGATKRQQLLDSLENERLHPYEESLPKEGNRFSFRPSAADAQYELWPKVIEFALIEHISGLQEMRKGDLMAIDRTTLEGRIQKYLDPGVSWEDLKPVAPGLMQDGGRFVAVDARKKILTKEKYSDAKIQRYLLYPFDNRWCFYSPVRPLWNEPRPDLVRQLWPGNRFFVTRMVAERPHEQITCLMTSNLPDYHLLRPNAVAIPLQVKLSQAKSASESGQGILIEPEPLRSKMKANLGNSVRKFLSGLGVKEPDSDQKSGALVWEHALAISYSAAYLAQNGIGIRQDWPRVPLPNSRDLLEASAGLGEQVAALLDTEAPVAKVTEGEIREELRRLGRVAKAGTEIPDSKFQIQESQLQEKDLAVTAGWGHGGKGGITMPGKGKLLKRDYSEAERRAIEAGAKAQGLTAEQAFAHLGPRTCDVYLNDVAYWSNVPVRVWEYTIGGYQVIKKWLSYREEKLLGRALMKDEVRYVQEMVRRIAAILLLEPALDENYRRVKENTFPWESLKRE